MSSPKDIIVVDDLIPLSLQEKYKRYLFEGQFPWYYVDDITTPQSLQFRPSMSHMIYDNGQKISTLDIDALAHLGAARYGWNFKAIAHAKTLLQFPLNRALIGKQEDNFHVDTDPFHPHLVVLYYVIDADGETLISNMRANSTATTILPYDDKAVIQRVKPKQGRAVLFDGSYFHTAGQPQTGMRCVININVY